MRIFNLFAAELFPGRMCCSFDYTVCYIRKMVQIQVLDLIFSLTMECRNDLAELAEKIYPAGMSTRNCNPFFACS